MVSWGSTEGRSLREVPTNEDRAEDLEDGGKTAGLANGEHLRPDAGAEAVGDIVGADAEGQNKCDDVADDDDPEEFL